MFFFLPCYGPRLSGVVRFLCRFNGLNFLEKYRGKKIMFVGDSLSLNQFNSLACMLHAWVPKSRSTFSQRDALSKVAFEVGSFHSCALIYIFIAQCFDFWNTSFFGVIVCPFKLCHFPFLAFKFLTEIWKLVSVISMFELKSATL